MENLKIESRCLKVCYEFFYWMYEGWFLQNRSSKIFNVFIGQKTWLCSSFKTCGRGFEMLSQAFQTRIYANVDE